jgi:AmmeMemoRadiSam system protein B
MSHVRPAAVAGLFYPGRAAELAATVEHLLREAEDAIRAGPPPKAIIAPHAGYIYSGAIAASAYVQLRPLAGRIRRVVLIGPCHRVPLQGLAVPSAAAFATPLGEVPVDREAVAALLTLPQVCVFDRTHADEHALEVHLPFLQEVLGHFAVVPIVAGRARADEVAETLERVWGGEETLIVVSSDLSHYLDYDRARAIDSVTCRAIEALDDTSIASDQACGSVPVAGLLTLARRRGLAVTTLDLRNSGDTAGDHARVVGYGAWMFTEPAGGRRAEADAARGR